MARKQSGRTSKATPVVPFATPIVSFDSYEDVGFQQAAARAQNIPAPVISNIPDPIITSPKPPAPSIVNVPKGDIPLSPFDDTPGLTPISVGGAGSGSGSGSGVGSGASGGGGNEPLTSQQQNALTIINGWMKEWGIEGLSDVVKSWIGQDKSEDAALFELRGTNAYAKRFPGMKLRADSNLAPINEATYLALEDDYDAWARYYGVEGSFGATAEERKINFGNLMGKNVNTTAFKDFVDTIVTRVDRADASIKKTLNNFYGITDTDLKNYYINPTENIKALQEKITAAEIGAAAASQALIASKETSEELARFGIDRERALTGYEKIAQGLAEGRRLSGIYREEGIDYTQQTAEEEEFKGLESAARKRRRLAALSEASFQQSGALTQGSLGGRETAGQI